MINKEKFKEVVARAIGGEKEARGLVYYALRPDKKDTVGDIYEKILYANKIYYGASMTIKDAPYHKEIDYFFAEQVYSYIHYGVPKYKGLMLVGYRESAKSARFRFNQSYLIVYLPHILDDINVVSEDGDSAKQFNMDMYNALALSRIPFFCGMQINETVDKVKKKESMTQGKFTTKSGVTFKATSARKSKRGNVKQEVDELRKIKTNRPKQVIFDDIETEVTVKSIASTESIKGVIDATIDGVDQILGWWAFLGNILSIRGNVKYFVNKYASDPSVKIINIPLYYQDGVTLSWPAKYCWTDEEQSKLLEQGINKVSVESLKRTSENFDTEFLNDPKRSDVYFTDSIIKQIDITNLISEEERGNDNWLIIEEPEKGAIYVMGNDAAIGNKGDQSTSTIFKVTKLQYIEVANFKSNTVRPEDFASDCVQKAREYNHAYIVPERNYPGNEFILAMKEIYNHYYIEKKNDSGNDIIGVHTNSKTKPDMFFNFKKLIKEGILIIRSQILYNQILEYPVYEIHKIENKPKGKVKDISGGHFDLLMSSVVGMFEASGVHVMKEDTIKIDNRLSEVVQDAFEESVNNL